jgi:hypothetical protein
MGGFRTPCAFHGAAIPRPSRVEMRKLKLQVEALVVESFSTQAAAVHGGTVLGHSGASCNTQDLETCANYNTCGGGESCNNWDSCFIKCGPHQVKDWLDNDENPATPCCTITCKP